MTNHHSTAKASTQSSGILGIDSIPGLITQPYVYEEALLAMLDLYKGPFLDKLDADGAPNFTDWLYAQRDGLEQTLLDGLRGMIAFCKTQGRYADGISFAEQVVSFDPLDEEARCELMLFLAHSGRRQEAHTVYDALVEMLDEEWGAPPSPETEAAYAAIQQLGDSATQDNDEAVPAIAMLPIFTTPFVGRQSELVALVEQVHTQGHRLVTVVGLGGTGKTYLAIEAARRIGELNQKEAGERAMIAQTLPQQILYVSLVDVPSVDQLPAVLMQALDLVATEQRDFVTQLCNYLASKNMLIVLDNMEHLLDTTSPSQRNAISGPSASQLISQLLQAAPQVQFMVTSRQPLQMQSEYIFNLTGMSLPATQKSNLFGLDELSNADSPTYDLATLRQSDAIQLFEQVAQRIDRDFELTTENQMPIVQFCTLVQGTPLAIVLGASQMDFMEPDELLEECQEGLDVLETEWLNLPPRQRSIRIVFEQSWQRLNSSLQLVFQKLTIFRGSFTMQAARQVAGASIRHIKQLHNQSLIRQVDQGRYEIHELLRQFGTEKFGTEKFGTEKFGTEKFSTDTFMGTERLPQSAEDWRPSVLGKHMQFYLERLSTFTEALQGPTSLETVTMLTPDLSNIQQAWHFASQQGVVTPMAKSLDAFVHLHQLQGRYQEAMAALTHTALAHTAESQPYTTPIQQVDTSSREFEAALFVAQSFLYTLLGNPARAIEMVQMVNTEDTDVQAFAHWVWARGLSMQGDGQAAGTQINHALTLAQQNTHSPSNQNLIADCLHLRGDIHFHNGQPQQAIQDVQQAQAYYRQTNNRHKEIDCLHSLATITKDLPQQTGATSYVEQVMALSGTLDDDINGQKAVLSNGYLSLQTGSYEEAAVLGRNALHFYEDIGDKWTQIDCHYLLGMVHTKVGQYQQAYWDYDKALYLSRDIGARKKQQQCLVGMAINYRLWGIYQEALNHLDEAKKITFSSGTAHDHDQFSIHAADIYRAWGRYDASIPHYQHALAFYTSTDEQAAYNESLAMHTRAGLAYALQQSGDLDAALYLMDEVLPYVERHADTPHVFYAPFELYWHCYCVLHADKDIRARSLLDGSMRLLHMYARRLSNKTWRSSFMENVRVHAEIMKS
ncbi:MAG: BTAD domain-containing putative transcriptional regulator [Chloroflexota bacterium]